MILILKRISETARVPDIMDFIDPVLQGGLLKKSGRIGNVTIQMLQENGSNQVEYHALVTIVPDTVGRRVVKQLNRKPFNGKPINVMEYSLRHYSNDRRQSRYESANNRRKMDRRRKNIKVDDITDASKRYAEQPVKDIDWY